MSGRSVVPMRIVFIGGVCTLNPDVSMDSRSPIPDDFGDHLIRSALSSSTQWWEAATGFAQTLLQQDPRNDAWVLVAGPGTLRALRGDRISRPKLASFLPGETARLDASDFRNTAVAPWTYVQRTSHINVRGRCRITEWDRVPPTAVIVSGHDLSAVSRQIELIEISEIWPTATLILPHCRRLEALADGLRAWYREGRQELSETWTLTPEMSEEGQQRATAGLKYGSQRPVVLDAHFSITRLIVDDEDLPSERLNAAAAFLESRYDLSLGIWDIVRDPGLSSLVSHLEPAYFRPQGEPLTSMPAEFMEQANRLAEVGQAVERVLSGFPLAEWHRHDGPNLSWLLRDPELPIDWILRVDSNSFVVFPLMTGGRLLPTEVEGGPWWHHGYGWKVGISPQGADRMRDLVSACLDEVRPRVRDLVRARLQ